MVRAPDKLVQMRDREKYVAANRVAWNEAASRHSAHNHAKLREQFIKGGCNFLEDEVVSMLEAIGVRDKSVVQIACNNGIDLLSLKGMGAGRCLGIDQAEQFLEEARELTELAGYENDVSFMAADAYALPEDLKDRFDIVLTTIGVLGWMPDLEDFFSTVSALIVSGGHWVMEETHPVLMMYEPGENGETSRIEHSYFRTEPFVETTGLDYFGHEQYASSANYSFTHKMSDIINAGIRVGLEVQGMDEVGRDISNFCADLELLDARPPLGLYLLWRKK